MKKVTLKYGDVVKIIKEQVEGEYYEITPEKYLEIMLLASYEGKSLSKIKMFKGLPLKITGSLDISGKPVTDLGNIGVIEGNLDISNTNVMSVAGIDIKGTVRDWNSGAYKARMRKIQLAKIANAESLRESGAWSLTSDDIDEEGEKANALFEFLVNEGILTTLDDEDIEEVSRLKSQIEGLTNDYDNEDDIEVSNVLYDEISELEEELSDLQYDKYDVYNLSPNDYGSYGMTSFEILEGDDGEYSVGTEEEMDDGAKEQIRDFINDSGLEGFREGYVENYIDMTYFREYVDQFYTDDIGYSPESYFDEDDYELTTEQDERISQIESEIERYTNEQSESEEDDYDEYEELIDGLQEELDDIIPDTDNPTDEMIENKVNDLVRDAANDPAQWMTENGIDIKDFIDEEDLIEGVFNDDGYDGILSYDGTYEVVTINDTDYYVFRTN